MKFLIGSDIVPTSATENYFVAGDLKTLYGGVVDLCKGMDRIIINLECALTDYDGAIKKFGPNLKATPAAVKGIKDLGVTDVALSNNHVFDFGIKGLRDTMETLDEAGIPYMGIGENDQDSRKPYFFEQGGKRFCIINVCEHEYSYALPNRVGANPFNPFTTMRDIREARKECDYLIVLYHGGKEYCQYPSPRLYELCHEMVYCGADVVITQHSHCVGCYEQFEGGHIVYGQGNFNFAYEELSSRNSLWMTSVLVELDIEDTLTVKFHPIVCTETGCDTASAEKAAEIMSGFEKRNAELLNGKWRDGWHAFCVDPAREYYHDKIVNACENDQRKHGFAHYLDCEAHTDVWRELYPTWNMTNEMD
ncbi:MAG: CapA family protein [Clostridia bacterium]|nr:CapA family protein [Clostridia bacterium]